MLTDNLRESRIALNSFSALLLCFILKRMVFVLFFFLMEGIAETVKRYKEKTVME